MRISDWSSDVCSSDLAKQTSTYTIPKMDCSAEEQMVRMALADIEAVKGLTFDLPNRKLKVFHNEGIQQITRSEEHTSELQSLMRISYAVFCLKKKIPSSY